MELNLFDLGVLIIVGLSALLSFFRGFVREVLSLGGWLIASVVTLRFIEPATEFVRPQVGSPVISSGIAAVGLFFITLIVISLAARFIVKILKPGEKVGLLDNLAGLAFGVARGALIVAIGYFVMDMVTSGKHPTIVRDAYTRPYVAATAKWLKTLAPEYLDRVTSDKKDSDEDLSDSVKESTKKMLRRMDDAEEKLQEELDQHENAMPSIEDLQQRIREENENGI